MAIDVKPLCCIAMDENGVGVASLESTGRKVDRHGLRRSSAKKIFSATLTMA